ncbi:acyl-CoA dehydrogenase [Cellulomonas chitinilytica]|uniref:Acyl-CoA dehydrogenase n=1 Tax=Cellulomonas chitinilytica TaxID=398759 RepID=A0A919P0H1_9CELL|nr:acyl-CoA dehydrogenase family protein [Cellulomonas chitinilytica]GIG19980.1 acyl-CoA dehydrogenase [Cellulomonas chitinilytica]
MAAPTLPLTPTALRAALRPVLDVLAAGSAAREAERRHPFAEVRELADLGVLRFRVPVDEGGAGASVRELVDLVIEIARADSNVAQALRPGFLVADGLAQDVTPSAARDRTLRRVLDGDLFAGTRNEADGRPGAVATTIVRDGDGYVVSGRKFYSTGGLHARWFSGSATDEDGVVVTFTVPTDRPGVQVLDDFDAVGQRLTASGTTVLEGVRVSADEVDAVRRSVGHPVGALAQLYLVAVLAGIAHAVLDDAVAFAQHRARPIKHSSADRSVDDPYVREAVGEIAAHAFAARSAALVAAEHLDVAWAAADGAPPTTDATIAVATAQVTAVRESLAAAQRLFDVGGGSATGRAHNLDRHWRNARTVANHNPVAWKAAVVGAHLLTGELPPSTGLF